MNDQNQSRADALTDDQRKALKTAVNVLNINWEHETANELWEAFTAPSLQPAAAPIESKIVGYRWRWPNSLSPNRWYADMRDNQVAYCQTMVEEMSARGAVAELVYSAPAPSPADERAAQELLPIDRKWVTAKAISLVAEYRNCKASETEEVMQRFVDYMQAALQDAAARAASANETGAEGAHALAHEVWSAAQRAPGEGIEDAVRRIAAILSRSPAMSTQPVRAWETDDGRVISDEQKQGAQAADPVAWRYLTPTGWHATTKLDKALGASAHHDMEPLYAAPQPAQADARVGLTDEQRESVDRAATWLDRSEDLQNKAHAERLRALLQGANHAE